MLWAGEKRRFSVKPKGIKEFEMDEKEEPRFCLKQKLSKCCFDVEGMCYKCLKTTIVIF